MGRPPPVPGQRAGADGQHATGQPPGYRAQEQRHRPGARRRQPARTQALPPDLAAIAREAVIAYLRDAAEGTAKIEAAPDGRSLAPAPSAVPAVAGRPAPEQVAVRAAEISLATLDRIEAAAAKLEADIATARAEQAELQAGAGKAAADAIKAAEAAWSAAGVAQEAGRRARLSVRVIFSYLVITAILVVIELIILVAVAASAH